VIWAQEKLKKNPPLALVPKADAPPHTDPDAAPVPKSDSPKVEEAIPPAPPLVGEKPAVSAEAAAPAAVADFSSFVPPPSPAAATESAMPTPAAPSDVAAPKPGIDTTPAPVSTDSKLGSPSAVPMSDPPPVPVPPAASGITPLSPPPPPATADAPPAPLPPPAKVVDLPPRDPLSSSSRGSEDPGKPNNIFRALAPAPTPSEPPVSPTAEITQASETAPSPNPAPDLNKATAATPAPPAKCPWTLNVKITQGRTELEARNGDTIQLHVSCATLNLQAPNGVIQAQGEVKITTPDLKGTCDQLSITWQDDGVVLAGKVHLDGRDMELNSERLTIKWNGNKSSKAGASSTRLPSGLSWMQLY
jgi:hypothetical protein